MQRGTKEFYKVKSSFEKAVNSGCFGYMSRDLTECNDFNSHTFYQNGSVNMAFHIFMNGYAAAKCEYQQ